MSAFDKLVWGCPDCGTTLTRRPYVDADGNGHHSWKCKSRLVAIEVRVK